MTDTSDCHGAPNHFGPVDVNSKCPSYPGPNVNAGETWSFSAHGRWKDWWISCGPDGYRNFLADIFQIEPRFAGQNWFCLCGEVEGTDDRFAIGRGCTHSFKKSGQVIFYANDLLTKYGNNHGSVELKAVRGGIGAGNPENDADIYKGLTGRWLLIRRTFEKTRGISTLAILVLGACLILALLPQGVDLVRAIGDDSLEAPKHQLIAFVLGLLFLGIQSWLWPRLLIDFNYGLDRTTWQPRRLLEWGPRALGVAPFLLVLAALVPQRNFGLPIVLVIVALGFLAFLIKREDLTRRIHKGPGRIGFAPWWIGACLLLAVALMVFAILAPVTFGHALGAPAVVFIGLGLIIPPTIIAIQTGGGLRLPIVATMLVAAGVFSLWMDNHAVGRRVFGRGPEPVAIAQRLTLAEAYAAWRKQQKDPPKDKALPIVLVASEGGASRAGDWTAEVLGALHQLSDGELAQNLFAISSVSGGSVGAVGYSAFLHIDPAVPPPQLAKSLPQFAGEDALSPTLTGMLFPDLLQRFLPFAFLPDRAEVLERAWETAWDDSCPADRKTCKELLRKPFLALGPKKDGPWRPILIVNGASEETGRRILTSTINLGKAVDADDFYQIVTNDVAISTAIHNGARFPWISPAGTLTKDGKRQGHILDGGYFDAAGVATLGELAQAIAALPDRTDPLHFIFVFIGFNGTTEQSRPPGEQPTQQSISTAGTKAAPEQTTSQETPEQQGNTAMLLNETLAPLFGLFASRTGHEVHIMNAFVNTPALPKNVTAEFVPLMLCKDKVDGRIFEPSMDWALSEAARKFIHAALGLQPDAPCVRNGVSANADTLKKIVAAIKR